MKLLISSADTKTASLNYKTETLSINPAFIESLTGDELIGLVQHEQAHLDAWKRGQEAAARMLNARSKALAKLVYDHPFYATLVGAGLVNPVNTTEAVPIGEPRFHPQFGCNATPLSDGTWALHTRDHGMWERYMDQIEKELDK